MHPHGSNEQHACHTSNRAHVIPSTKLNGFSTMCCCLKKEATPSEMLCSIHSNLEYTDLCSVTPSAHWSRIYSRLGSTPHHNRVPCLSVSVPTPAATLGSEPQAAGSSTSLSSHSAWCLMGCISTVTGVVFTGTM